jgi:hypothetical protein
VRTLQRIIIGAALVAFVSINTGCPGRLDDPDQYLDGGSSTDGGDSCADELVEAKLSASCGSASCHGASTPLDLDSPGVRERLVGVTTSCGDLPMARFLVEKLSPNPSCGVRMPFGGTPYSDEEEACLVKYLGALLDGGSAGGGGPGTGGGAGATGGGGGSDGGSNQPPTVAANINGPATAYAGQVLLLSVTATDPDGDALTYTWTQVAADGGTGTFSATNSASVTWYSRLTTTAAQYELRVAVTDGKSTPVSRTLSVGVQPPTMTNVFDTFLGGSQCTGCHGVSGSYSVGASASAAHANLVNVAHHRGAACVDAGIARLVVANDPARSLLFRKIAGTLPDAGCGERMPRGQAARPPSDVITLESWIRAGALNN